jgi:hypothetical protein
VTIPASVTSIGSSVFTGCSALKKVVFFGAPPLGFGSSSFSATRFYYPTGTAELLDAWTAKFESLAPWGTTEFVGYNRQQDGLLYQVSGGSAAVVGTYEKMPYTMVVPERIGNRYAVTMINNGAFRDCDRLISVTIPSSVVEIGDDAFRNCQNLVSVMIANGVTSIGAYAFYDCTSLTSVTIPSSVTSIGLSAFYGCRSLMSFDVDSENQHYSSISGLLYCKDTTTLIACPRGMTSVMIPEGVTTIGSSAFYNCYQLTSVVIPEGVTTIESSAFASCYNLASVIIPESVTSIGEYAFSGCDLTSVTIPSRVIKIGDNAFPKNVSIDFSGILECSRWPENLDRSLQVSVVIPDGVTSIDGGAFYGCSNLTSLTIPASVTKISGNPFSGCTNLRYVFFEGPPPIQQTTSVTAAGSGYTLWNIPFDGLTITASYRVKYAKEWEVQILADMWTFATFVLDEVGVSTNIFGAGKITTSAEDGIVVYFPKGEIRRLKAEPDEGYVFMGWSGDVISTENEIELNGNVDKYTLNVQFLPKSLLKDFVASNDSSSGMGGVNEGLSKTEVVSTINEIIVEMLNSGALISAKDVKVEAGKVVDQKMEEKHVVTKDQIDDMAMDTPVIDMTKGKGTLSLSLKKASSLSDNDWKNVLIENPTIDANGNIKVEISPNEDERAAFYKFVVPAEQ